MLWISILNLGTKICYQNEIQYFQNGKLRFISLHQDYLEEKLKQLEKLETKIEQNLETHKKSLDFFEQNDNCPVCTQKIEEKFRDEKINKERTKHDNTLK